MNLLKHSWPIILFIAIVIIFFRPFIFQGKMPIPSDTIVGLYHPYRDFYASDYPNGIPFKNFLITDPVRQQYPWRHLSIDLLKKGELAVWNPYVFGGTPLLANHQSAPFYPLNIFLLIFPFELGWSVLILLQPLLTLFFMYAYLRNLSIEKVPSVLGSIAFALSGFFVAWLEWGTILHVGLWLPLILLSTDKIFSTLKSSNSSKLETQNAKLHFKSKKYLTWSGVFVFSLISSFFAGHLQTFFYVVTASVVYFFARWIQFGRSKKILFLFIIHYSLFIILTSVQWIPTLQFILESARNLDQVDWQKPGWFIPWQHLVQFIAPDFFGNPTTLNYWGEWNYAEFIGYIGIPPLIFALFALAFRRDKNTLFYGTIFFMSLLFSFSTVLARLPYIINIPFLSTAQPTRLIFITDFSLAVLAALGLDFFMKSKKNIQPTVIFIGIILLSLWLFTFFVNNIIKLISEDNIEVAKRNLVLPTVLFMSSAVLFYTLRLFYNVRHVALMIYIIIMVVTVFDLLRFAEKFTPFTNKEYLFPTTKVIKFLKEKEQQEGPFRVMSVDNRILPPNFSIMYKLQTVDGYDPLYLRRFGELIAASERGEPNIEPPFGFNRIITPHRYDSKIIDLLGVKYVLSLVDLESPRLVKVFQEGQTRVYENKNVLPRTFFVETVEQVKVEDRQRTIEAFYKDGFNIRKQAVIEGFLENNVLTFMDVKAVLGVGKAEISSYSENKLVIETENDKYGFLVLTDSFYPAWHAKIDGAETKIYLTDYNFRGIFVPPGKHRIEFYVRIK